MKCLQQFQEKQKPAYAIVVVDIDNVTDKRTEDMHLLGARGIRLNFQANAKAIDTIEVVSYLQRAANRIKHLAGWMIQVYIHLDLTTSESVRRYFADRCSRPATDGIFLTTIPACCMGLHTLWYAENMSFHNIQADSDGSRLAIHSRSPISTPMTRRHVACVRCRRRKQRCDGLLPACANCSRAGVGCIQDVTSSNVSRR